MIQYGIVVLYETENRTKENKPRNIVYGEQRFLGLSNSNKFVYEKEITSRTKIFNSQIEADSYIWEFKLDSLDFIKWSYPLSIETIEKKNV